MKTFKPIVRSLYVPAVLFLGACCCEKEVVPPPPPPPAVVPAPIVLPMSNIYFDFDRSEVTQSAADQMQVNAQWMAANPAARVVIEGHADERGTNEYNMALGQRRADAARDYLVGIGVDPARLRTVSYGEEQPADPGHTEEAWAKNRRVVFVGE